MSHLPRNKSQRLSPKKNLSKVKLPRLETTNNDQRLPASLQKQVKTPKKSQATIDKKIRNFLSVKLQPLKQPLKIRQSIVDELLTKRKDKPQNSSRKVQDSLKVTRKQDNILKLGNTTKSSSQVGSNGVPHILLQKLNKLLSPALQKEFVTAKVEEGNFGALSPLWWAQVDSILMTIQKTCKKKQVNGQISKIYACLQDEITNNQTTILKYYEDQNHVALLVESFFYEKVCIYIIGSTQKWGVDQQILSWASKAVPNLLLNRRLMLDILIQAVSFQIQDNKLRKPKYIGRQKKLIQISKVNSTLKQAFLKTIAKLTFQYEIFQINPPQSHQQLKSTQLFWKERIFGIPQSPFFRNLKKDKLLFVFQPQDFLFKLNKKNETFVLRPFAEIFLKKIQQNYTFIIFTAGTQHDALIFVKNIQGVSIKRILTKKHISYKQAKPIKNLNKISNDLNMVVAIDKDSQYYAFHKQCFKQFDRNWGNQQYLLQLAEKLNEHAQLQKQRIRIRLTRMNSIQSPRKQ